VSTVSGATIDIIPIGGLGEVGRNMTLIRSGQDRIVVDCGVGFARDASQDGVELLLPDVAAIGPDPISTVIVTHGHDDHLAALRHLVATGAPIGRILGLPFTIELVRAKLGSEVPLPPLVSAVPGRVVTDGTFSYEFVRVAHSIPDAAAVVITTPVGRVVATGDYKLDATQHRPGRRADLSALAALGRDGVLVMLGDSTYAPIGGRTASEDSTLQPLRDVVAAAPGRVVLTCFASNIDRVDHAMRAADESGRNITLLGRSMRRNAAIANRLGELDSPRRARVQPRDLAATKPRRSLVCCTGSQAESNAVLARAARGEHPQLVLSARDTVVFASRPVPGNEQAVEALLAGIDARGCRLVTHEDAAIHVSGHARADEIAEMIGLLQPRFVLPVHGEQAMLNAHRLIAIERCGLAPDQVIAATNGDVITLTTGSARLSDRIPVRVIGADTDGAPIGPAEAW
jgi:ribonuclease J